MTLNLYSRKCVIVFSLAPPGEGRGEGALLKYFLYNILRTLYLTPTLSYKGEGVNTRLLCR